MKRPFYLFFLACILLLTLVTSCPNDIFNETKYKLTVISGGNGSTSPSGTIDVVQGETVTIKAIPKEGFHFSSWEFAGETTGSLGNVNAATTTIVLNNGDVTIKANFADNAYNLTFDNDGNGTTNRTGTIQVGHNEVVSIIATPNQCYRFAGWTVSAGDAGCVKFGNAAAAATTVAIECDGVTVKANFTIKSYILMLRSGDGGGIKLPLVDRKEIVCGSPEAISAEPDAGYTFRKWTVENNGSATFDDPNASSTNVRVYSDATIKANFCNKSVLPSGISANPVSVCPGNTVTLSIVGGTLGVDAGWKWYAGTCGGGASIGSGSSITVTIDKAATFFVRAEGPCETSVCKSIAVTPKSVSVAPTSVTASSPTVCPGGSVTLTVSGGTLGTGASWKWYKDTEGGTLVGTTAVTTLQVTPDKTTTYFVRAEGDCGTTASKSVKVTMNTASADPESISASANVNCPGNTVTLAVNGGSLGTGASWVWYSGSVGGTVVGTTTARTITVTPKETTTYFVRAEGDCGATASKSVKVTMNTVSVDPESISASADVFCPGNTITLTVNGGSLGTGASWVWYSGSVGGTVVVTTTARTISVTPTEATTYFVRAEGGCRSTKNVSKVVSLAKYSLTLLNNHYIPGGNTPCSYESGGDTTPQGIVIVNCGEAVTISATHVENDCINNTNTTYYFISWKVISGSAAFANANSRTTTVILSSDAVIQPQYQ